MGWLSTIGTLGCILGIILLLPLALFGFASSVLISPATQEQALTSSGLLSHFITSVSNQTATTIPETAVKSLVKANIPRITAYLASSQSTLDLDLSLSESDFQTIFGTLPPCQQSQQPLQEGKLICKPSTPLSLIAQGTTTSISQTEQQLTKGFAQAKQGIKTVQQITWLTFLLSLTLLGVIGALNHNEKASMFAWLTVACALPGFIALGASLLASNMFSSFLPTNSPALTTYLSSLLTALTARLKLYALITLAFSLISLFCSFYTRK